MHQEILLIGTDGKQMGKMSYDEALNIAKEQSLGLVQVNKDQGIFKIGDVGKLKYDKKRKQKKQREQRRAQKIKEIQLRPTIDHGDLEIKIKRARGFLESGMKTKVIMKFKKQQMLHKDLGIQKMNEVIDMLTANDLAVAEGHPTLEGRNITVFLKPCK